MYSIDFLKQLTKGKTHQQTNKKSFVGAFLLVYFGSTHIARSMKNTLKFMANTSKTAILNGTVKLQTNVTATEVVTSPIHSALSPPAKCQNHLSLQPQHIYAMCSTNMQARTQENMNKIIYSHGTACDKFSLQCDAEQTCCVRAGREILTNFTVYYLKELKKDHSLNISSKYFGKSLGISQYIDLTDLFKTKVIYF